VGDQVHAENLAGDDRNLFQGAGQFDPAAFSPAACMNLGLASATSNATLPSGMGMLYFLKSSLA
jgi:hypothetical protein